MQTLQPTLRLGRDVWDRANLPEEEFRARVDRLRAAMRDRGLDVLLLYGNGLDECGYPTYLSNYTVKLPFAALVILPLQGDLVLMFEGSTRGRSAAQATTWIDDVRPCSNIAETCAGALAEKGLSDAAIGLAGVERLMPYDQLDLLTAALVGAKCVHAEALVDQLRSVKSDREINLINSASRIVRQTLQAIGALHFDPVIETLIAARLIYDARMQGAEDVRVMIADPLDPDLIFRPAEDCVIAGSSSVVVLCRASWERYWAQEIRTYRVRSGRLESACSESDMAWFDSVIQGFAPGRTVTESLGDLASCCTAHGIGVTAVEPPLLPQDHGTRLQAGMCLSICATRPLTGGAATVLGETFVIGTPRRTPLP
jgi:Xaa-Pro aminopeptidase